MGLFGKKEGSEEINLFFEGREFKIIDFPGNKITVRVDNHFIRIARKNTVSNLLLHGVDGEKSILLKSITSYQLKAPGKTTGYLQIAYPGSSESKAGVNAAIQDENTILFTKDEIEQAYELKMIIESAIIDNYN